MKKLFVLLCIGFFLVSCNNWTNKDGQSFEPSGTLDLSHVIVVDGCEYFVISGYASHTFVHKGNCSNPIHYQNQIVKKSTIKFYNPDGNYQGYLLIDSIVINYKKKSLQCWGQGNLAYMTQLRDLGMTTMDIKK